ncbi:MAG: hypothetical protein VB086_06840 [Clostridiaceae bacterium]|nr:hypothetical protein [Clostridiaceae bacterium]
MKRLLICALILALLCGCTPTAQDPQQPPVSDPEETQDPGPTVPAVTETGYFSRTEVIRRNEHEEGFFLATKRWASEYAEQTWPDSEYTVNYLSGFSAPSAMFTDFLSGGSALWTITVSQADGQALNETVQALYFADGGEIYLSGLLVGDELLETRPEVYAYLRLDTRFSARMCDLPDVVPPKGLLGSYDLAMLFGTEGCDAELLDADTAVLHDLNWTSEDGEHQLAVVDLPSGKTLHSQTLSGESGSWRVGDVSGGVLTLTHYTDGGRDQMIYASRDGIEQKTLYPEAAYRFPMGDDRFVESKGNSLYEIVRDPLTGQETETLLLQGVDSQDETAAAFTFRQALSDDQFVYDYMGYEWYNRSGVYDLSTGTDYVITVPQVVGGEVQQADTRMLYVDLETAVTALDDYGYYHFSVTDRETGTTRLLKLGYEDPEDRTAQAVSDGTRLLLMKDSGDEAQNYKIELYDLQGNLLWSWELIGAVTGGVVVSLMDAKTVGVQFFSLLTGTAQLYVISAA